MTLVTKLKLLLKRAIWTVDLVCRNAMAIGCVQFHKFKFVKLVYMRSIQWRLVLCVVRYGTGFVVEPYCSRVGRDSSIGKLF